jgi:hypothetical protein
MEQLLSGNYQELSKRAKRQLAAVPRTEELTKLTVLQSQLRREIKSTIENIHLMNQLGKRRSKKVRDLYKINILQNHQPPHQSNRVKVARPLLPAPDFIEGEAVSEKSKNK